MKENIFFYIKLAKGQSRFAAIVTIACIEFNLATKEKALD